MDLLTCIREKKAAVFEYFSRRSKTESTFLVIPLQIQVSTQSGRRFVTVMNARTRRLHNVRLDGILKVEIRDKVEQYDKLYEKYQHAVKKCWGVSYGGKDNPRMQQIFVKLRIDEEKEPYILERIKREGRGGELLKIRENEFLYSNEVHDVNEVFRQRIKREWVEFEIYDERNALERVTLHFSNYEKHIEYVKERKCWLCRMYYDWNDQKEILVSLLSFGPVLKVLGPSEFVEMIKIRLYRQRKVME